MNRYEWEDALIEAQTGNVIGNGELLMALKFARAINWSPRDGRPAGLYWKNENAWTAVGSSRATYYRRVGVLKESGFFVEVGGNLLPTLPSLKGETQDVSTHQVSLKSETEQSQPETEESQSETQQSQSDNPLSEDTCSKDVWIEDSFSERQSPAVPAVDPTVSETSHTGTSLNDTGNASLPKTGDEEVTSMSGRKWLRTLLDRERAAPDKRERAWELYNDPTWKVDRQGQQRAALAMLYGSPNVTKDVEKDLVRTPDDDAW